MLLGLRLTPVRGHTRRLGSHRRHATCEPVSMTTEPRHLQATIDGVRVHWAELGEASAAAPVILLHGLYDSHRSWKHVAPALARDRRVLIPDLPGHGLSERADASYELVWHARVVRRWIESLGLGHVDIVGHSFGGGVAQMLLLECLERIRRLILVASGGLGREIRTALRLAAAPRIVERFGQPFMGIGTYLALAGHPGFTLADLRELARMNAMPGSARAFARTVRDIIDWRGQRRGFFDRAHEIAVLPPIAVLWGDRDKIIPIAHGKSFASALEDVVFVQFDGCGHFLHRERPDAFVGTVRNLLDAPTSRAARLRRISSALAGEAPAVHPQHHDRAWPAATGGAALPRSARSRGG
jgi:pimeloyl-ACP methyl ester carboxylesterase